MNKHDVSISWNDCTQEAWQSFLSQAPHSNYFHTWEYGLAAEATTKQQPLRGVVFHKGAPIGMVQATEKSYLWGLFSMVRVMRGPIWLKTDIPEYIKACALYEIQCDLKNGLKRILSIMPEMEMSDLSIEILKGLNFRRAMKGHTTSIISLQKPVEDLRKGLKQKWRNGLNAAERRGLQVSNDGDLDLLLDNYTWQKRTKGFAAPPAKFYRAYIDSGGAYLHLTAKLACDPVADILVFLHGQGATYVIGHTTEEGRKTNANYLLLWHAIESLQRSGYIEFDLGGIHMNRAQGVTHFKQGLGGEDLTLAGVFV